MQTVTEMAPRLGVALTWAALGLPRATYYRGQQPRLRPKPRPVPVRAPPPEEREQVLAVLHEQRFADLAQDEVYATLLDEDRHPCTERSFYRVLAANAEVRERRDQLRHPHYTTPELLATCPNELWNWDITKLLGPAKWAYYYLYVLLDVFSRYAVGWLLAHRESAHLAEKLIAESCERQRIQPGQLTVHAGRGVRTPPRAVPPGAAATQGGAERGVDQPTGEVCGRRRGRKHHDPGVGDSVKSRSWGDCGVRPDVILRRSNDSSESCDLVVYRGLRSLFRRGFDTSPERRASERGLSRVRGRMARHRDCDCEEKPRGEEDSSRHLEQGHGADGAENPPRLMPKPADSEDGSRQRAKLTSEEPCIAVAQ